MPLLIPMFMRILGPTMVMIPPTIIGTQRKIGASSCQFANANHPKINIHMAENMMLDLMKAGWVAKSPTSAAESSAVHGLRWRTLIKAPTARNEKTIAKAFVSFRSGFSNKITSTVKTPRTWAAMNAGGIFAPYRIAHATTPMAVPNAAPSKGKPNGARMVNTRNGSKKMCATR